MTDEIIVDTPLPGVRRITLNRPETLNAFTWTMYGALVEALAEIGRSAEVRSVILTGNGRGFCSGHDLKNAGTPPHAPEGVGKLYAGRYNMQGISCIPVLMRELPQPIICAVNGVAAGIGYTLMLASDMAVAARSASFVNTVHNAATGAELGMSYLLPRAIGSQRAAELLLTARRVAADEAERIGLVLRTVDDAMLMDEALGIARNIAANVPMGIWLTKSSLWLNQTAGSLQAAIELESRAVQIAQATADAVEKRASFMEKRIPNFTMS